MEKKNNNNDNHFDLYILFTIHFVFLYFFLPDIMLKSQGKKKEKEKSDWGIF